MEIIDDALVEGNEQFSLTITTDSSANAQPVSGQDLSTVAIIDNDFGRYISYKIAHIGHGSIVLIMGFTSTH